MLRAKIEAVIAIIAVIFAPLVAVIAIASPWHAAITGAGIVIAAGCATAIQLWFRTQAKRSQFRRRQVSSRVATFAEAFSSIGWAATAAVAAGQSAARHSARPDRARRRRRHPPARAAAGKRRLRIIPLIPAQAGTV